MIKSIDWYESKDIKNPQSVTLLPEKEIFEKLSELCEQKWRRL